MDYPHPVGIEAGRYLFRVRDLGEIAVTLEELHDRDTLVRLCGGDSRFLRSSFPRRYAPLYGPEGLRSQTPIGIDTEAAARWCVGLCVDAQQRRLDALYADFRHAPGPIDHLMAWLRSWRPRRRPTAGGAA